MFGVLKDTWHQSAAATVIALTMKQFAWMLPPEIGDPNRYGSRLVQEFWALHRAKIDGSHGTRPMKELLAAAAIAYSIETECASDPNMATANALLLSTILKEVAATARERKFGVVDEQLMQYAAEVLHDTMDGGADADAQQGSDASQTP